MTHPTNHSLDPIVLQKRIKELEAENKAMRDLLEEYRDTMRILSMRMNLTVRDVATYLNPINDKVNTHLG